MITNLNARAPIGWAAYRRIDLVAMVKKHVPEKDRPEDLESMTKDTQLIPLLDGLVLQGKMPKPESIIVKPKAPEVAALEEQLKVMQAQLAELTKPRVGRPPKDD